MTGVVHVPYFNLYLNEDYCHADGEPWPCLQFRQDHPRCKCSHAGVNHSATTGICWFGPCGCQTFDPSPEPIDRSIQ